MITNPYVFPGKNEQKYKGYWEILNTVAVLYDLEPDQLIARSRKRCYVEPRRIVFFLLRKYCKMPFQRIAKLFMMNHATVIWHVRQFENHWETDKEFKNKIAHII